MWRTTLASLRGHKRRVLATCSAVLLGVTFLAGTLVLGDTMRSGFGGLFEEANAGTDALVRSDTKIESGGFAEAGTLDEAMVDRVRAVDGVAAAAPVVDGLGQIVGSDGKTIGGGGPPTMAGNWVLEDRLNPYSLDEGRAPEAADEVVIDRRSADQGDLEVGDRTVVRTPDPVEVTVVGIARFGSEDSLSGITFAGFTTEAAQEHLLAAPGQVTGVVVAAEEGLSQQDLVERLRPVLPDGAEALTGEELTAEQQDDIESDFLGFFETFLLVFAGIALVVATFSIYNTFSIVVAQRTRESALLRALGASRRQVLSAVVAEALVVGLLASGLGVVAGIGLSRGLSALMDALDLNLPTSDLVVESSSIVVSMVVGLMVTLLAGIAPAVKASRVPPMAAFRESAVDRAAASRLRLVAGSVSVAIGAAATLAGAFGGDLPITGLGALLLVVGVVLFGPVAARPVSGLLGAPLAGLRGVSGHLARANALRNPTRTAGTASALMVGVAVVAMFTVVAASLKAYVDEQVEKTVRSDLVILNEDFSSVGFGPELAVEVAALPEVETAAALGPTVLRLDGRDTFVQAADGPELDRMLDVDVREGSLTDLAEGTVAVSTRYADDHDLALGSSMTASFVDGSETVLEVAALYQNQDVVGPVLISDQTRAGKVAQVVDDVVFVGFADGVDPVEGRAAVQAAVDRFSGPDVQDRGEFVERESGEIDQILAVVYVLLALAVIIALMSIGNTLSLSIHERTRELGLLRAVGQSRRQLRTMVRGEALIVALFGTVGGLGLGCFLGWALMRALVEEEGLAWAFALPTSQLAVVFVLGGLAGLIASLRPARRAARLDVLEAIATE